MARTIGADRDLDQSVDRDLLAAIIGGRREVEAVAGEDAKD
jgi:hypothetical protein